MVISSAIASNFQTHLSKSLRQFAKLTDCVKKILQDFCEQSLQVLASLVLDLRGLIFLLLLTLRCSLY